MAGDDILWKNVEALKEPSPPAPKVAPRRSETRRKRTLQAKTVSASITATNSGAAPLPVASDDTASIADSAAKTHPQHKTISVPANSRSAVRAHGLPHPVPARPAFRKPERYAFQFYDDQITRLKKLRQVLNMAKDPEDRDEITLSDLAREAFDEYLDRQIRQYESHERTNA